jgi:hypothetical protein
MSSELTPEELAVVAELVGPNLLQLDLAALESSVRNFRRDMVDLRASFGALEAPDRGTSEVAR